MKKSIKLALFCWVLCIALISVVACTGSHTEHSYVTHDAKAPTCTEVGWEDYRTCEDCDYTTYEEIPALGHDVVTHEGKAPTCTETGWATYETCKDCDYNTYAEIPAVGHTTVSHTAKTPTCTEVGWEAYETCAVCDYTTYEEIPATGHTIVSHDAKTPTCTEVGWAAYESCEGCGYTTYAEIPAVGHTTVSHAAKAPTCTEMGWEAYETCAVCDYTTYEEIPATGHTIVSHDAKTPTCTEVGWAAYESCESCGYTTYAEIPAVGHTTVSHAAKAPTCTEMGWEAYETCAVCDYTTYKDTPATGHAIVSHAAKAPTCTEMGWEAYETCANCDYNTYAESPATGHNILSCEAKEPVCAEVGWEAYEYCTKCSYSTYKEIAAPGHSIVSHSGKSATCTEDGWKPYETCNNCSYTTYEVIASVGHVIVQHPGKQPTCTEGGWNAYATCGSCGLSTYTELPALGHSKIYHEAKAPTCTEIGWEAYESCGKCSYSTYVELPVIDHSMVDGVCAVCGYAAKRIVVTSNVSSVLMNGADQYTVIIYAQVYGDADITSVALKYLNGLYYCEMRDDGQYSISGDELANDNVYTLKVTIYVDTEMSCNFIATSSGNDVLTSNELVIDYINGITEQELDNMETVDGTIDSGVFEQDNFSSMTTEEKKVAVEEQLTALENQALITPGSVIYNDNTASFTFQYESGALGAIVLEELGKDTAVDLELDGGNLTSGDLNSKIDAIILWSFGQLWDDPSFRTGFYSDAIEAWNNNGIASTVDWDVTIEDYKKLAQYEIIVLSAHGCYYEYKTGHIYTEKLPSIILCERATREKDKLYAEDLKMHRIGKISVLGGTMYTILPDFWTYYYGAGALDGSFVFSESCEFAGVNSEVDEKMFDAILSGSAESVIGFHNSVAADYSRNLMEYYVSALIAGYTTGEAFEMAKNYYGADDYFPGREWFGPTAYPVFRGNTSSALVSSSLENGSFEDDVALSGWEHSGDVRVLTQLGALSPTDRDNMAILTTGIGSGESGYLEATEGSVLYQTFYVDAAHTTLSFYYNVVSEEPSEYVGSQFDDKFYTEIVASDGSKYTLATESVNASVWYSVSGIDFESGDSTTYETGWKLIEYDVSAFKGQYVTIRFVTYDVGDSAYDTAALIDNVTLH